MIKVVYLNDAKVLYEDAVAYFTDADLWAKKQCQSYIGHHVQDVSDVSYVYDHVAEYRFKDPKDALMFELKWKST